MAKYSTGGGADGGGGGACELCGRETDDLSEATVAGATLAVCGECAPHDEGSDREGKSRDEDRSRRAAQNVARLSDAAGNDPDHWVDEGAEYERDQLPYLVSDYDQQVQQARQEAGLRRDELAEELGVAENDLIAVEQGRAARAGVGGSVVRELEERLDLTLVENE